MAERALLTMSYAIAGVQGGRSQQWLHLALSSLLMVQCRLV